jgi:hypothetical protein
MSDRRNDSAGARYYVTLKGLEALELADACLCVLKIRDGLVDCPSCGTVYGTVKQITDRMFMMSGYRENRGDD